MTAEKLRRTPLDTMKAISNKHRLLCYTPKQVIEPAEIPITTRVRIGNPHRLKA
ncbi:MAG: hypothetical protein K0U39_01505 [Alphaproteobacteria bacterium]|nr:hypothetical protein [Alphaproteobacteria bacterium]